MVTDEAPLTDILAPFIQSKALLRLLSDIPVANNLRVLTRWNQDDLKSGVSDPEVYTLLKSMDIPLFIHPKLHSKIFLASNNKGMVGSGNLTGSGLGLSDSILQTETAAIVCFSKLDRLRVDNLFEGSDFVTPEMYESAIRLALNNEEIEFKDTKEPLYSNFNLSDLPATDCPEKLWSIYQAGYPDEMADASVIKAWSDLLRYQIPMNIKYKHEFDTLVKAQFLSRPLVARVLDFIKEFTPIGKAAFNPKYEGVQNGAVRKMLAKLETGGHNNIAEKVNNLQKWLPYCEPEIAVQVSVPGSGSSRVFVWRTKSLSGK